MKYYFLILLASFSSFNLNAQIQVSQLNGGSVITKLGLGVKVNDGSSLERKWIILNDPQCPIQLNEVGINTQYSSSQYSFNPTGNIGISEPITAYEIHFVLYNIFGDHMETLKTSEIKDINDKSSIGKSGGWYASERDVSEYFICVAYVARVRTKVGVTWKCNLSNIKDELQKIKIAFDDSYLPSTDKKK